MIDRRTKIQEILDKMEPDWVVVEPVKGSLDTRCKLRKPNERRQVLVDLPLVWFEDGKWDRIETAIRGAIEAATKQT